MVYKSMKRANKVMNIIYMTILFVVMIGSVLWSYGARFGLKTNKNRNHKNDKETVPGLDYGTGSMFDLIATRYDFVNRVLALNMDMSWRRRMIQELELQPGDRVLDLATGTADVAILLATEGSSMASSNAHIMGNTDKTCSAGDDNSEKSSTSTPACENDYNDGLINVLGLDPSQNMIAVGKEKVKGRQLDHVIKLDIGDARSLSHVKDNSFDKVTMAFGIRNVPEREKVLCEIHRVLNKTKGHRSKMAILEFSEPDENSGIMGFGARLFIRYVVPFVGAVFSGAPTEYLHLQNSIQHFPSPEQFAETINDVQCGEENGGFNVEPVVQLNFGSVQIYQAVPY